MTEPIWQQEWKKTRDHYKRIEEKERKKRVAIADKLNVIKNNLLDKERDLPSILAKSSLVRDILIRDMTERCFMSECRLTAAGAKLIVKAVIEERDLVESDIRLGY